MPRSRRNSNNADPSRRDFMRTAACAALTTTSIVSTVWDLRMINAAAADKLDASFDSTNYKAMVCIFLSGGNDANNLLIPTDARYAAEYKPTRGNLALPLTDVAADPINGIPAQSGLLPINATNVGSQTYGLHPACTKLQSLFNTGKLAIVANTGTLAYPITRAQYLARSVPVPLQLFSHSDQVIQWQTSVPDRPSRTGWGGRCADLLHSLNGTSNVSMSMSLAGANTFEVGNIINQFNISPGAAVSLTNIDAARKNAMKDLLAMGHPNLYEDAFATITNRAIVGADDVNNAITSTASSSYWTVPFPGTSLGNQLKMIARLIQARGNSLLNQNRQIFFATVGGYDLHSTQTTGNNPTTGSHFNLLNELSECMYAFQKAMEQLALTTPEITNQVTTFTMSDFSRTARSNATGTSNGTDHGWGSHTLVMGGAGGGTGIVNGQKIYGTFPSLIPNQGDDTDNNSNAANSTGRWIPTTAVDQYSATLARWFGATDTDLKNTVFPNLSRFTNTDLQFMNNNLASAVPASAAPTKPPTRAPTPKTS